jgi:hypothetical protein
MTGPLWIMVIWLFIPGHGQDEGMIWGPSCAANQATAEQWARNARAELQIVSCERAR